MVLLRMACLYCLAPTSLVLSVSNRPLCRARRSRLMWSALRDDAAFCRVLQDGLTRPCKEAPRLPRAWFHRRMPMANSLVHIATRRIFMLST
jgi:hypothetical protein